MSSMAPVPSSFPGSPTNITPLGFNYTCPDADQPTQTVIFVSETSRSTLSASTLGDCMAACSAAGNQFMGPLCKGYSFDLTTCTLYSQALQAHLIQAPGIDSAILHDVQGNSNSTFQNRTGSPAESSSAVASVTSGITLITPPPLVAIEYITSATIIWQTTLEIGGSGNGSNDAGDGVGPAVPASTTVSGVLFTAVCTVFSGATSGQTGTGGVLPPSPSESTLVLNSTSVIETTSITSGPTSGATGTGGVLPPSPSESTLVLNSTSINATTSITSGETSGATGTGGVFPTSNVTVIESSATSASTPDLGTRGASPTVSVLVFNSASVSVGTAESSGETGGGTGTGGVFPTVSTLVFNSTSVSIGTALSSGPTGGATGTGGVLPQSGIPSSTTYFLNTSAIEATLSSAPSGVILPSPNTTVASINVTTETIIVTSVTSGVTSGNTGTGGVFPPFSVSFNVSEVTFSLSPATSGSASEATGTGSVLPTGNVTAINSISVTTMTTSTPSLNATAATSLPPLNTTSLPVETGSSEVPSLNSTSPAPSGIGSPPSPLNGTSTGPTGTGPSTLTNGTTTPSSTGENRSGTASPPADTYTQEYNITFPSGTAPGPSASLPAPLNGTSPSSTGENRSGTASPPVETPPGTNLHERESERHGSPPEGPSSSPGINGTVPLGTGTAPYPSANSTLPAGTGTAPPSAPSSGLPVPSMNFISPFGTGTAPAPSGFPSPPLNASTPGPTGTALTPANSTAPSTETGNRSRTASPPSALGFNISTPLGTGTAPYPPFNASTPRPTGTVSAESGNRSGTASPPSFPGINNTAPLGTGTAPVTAPVPMFPTGTVPCPASGLPSGSPPFAPSESMCVTVTSVSVVTQIAYTSGSPDSSPSPSPPSAPVNNTAAIAALTSLRPANKSATEAQVAASCANIGNLIVNGEFELSDANSEPLGWGFATASPTITFSAPEDAGQHTPGGSRLTRVASSDVGAEWSVLQALTLCSGAQYRVGGVVPTVGWTDAMADRVDYTATDPNVMLEVRVRCEGVPGADGEMTLDFDDGTIESVI
ncbi:hypothetical protein EJ06DRAFT_522975 [Trichodelitschia bisporula]|uniref:Apple domain-containing protein n=1 Tax=Trichodelitschia bisporula TaxID=703511 RepID=A0A6G1HRS0_9PEZI|nr:hypothetical protein EJ06DRAFT_522975 [Trichodelitschia bisporula]